MKKIVENSGSSVIDSIEALIAQHLRWLQLSQQSKVTQYGQHRGLIKFQQWCDQQSLENPIDITLQHLESYQRYLYHQKSIQGKAYSSTYQKCLLWVVKRCFYLAYKQGYLLTNPADDLILPICPRYHVKKVLSEEEIEKILAQPRCDSPQSLRNRAMLEVLYACALRRGELVRLNQDDVDTEQELLTLREPKNREDRNVPISPRALQWIARYQKEARPKLLKGKENQALFISQKGARQSAATFYGHVKTYIDQVLPDKSGGCHLMRHSVATLLLNNGCDIRIIQEFLGHKKLSTTQYYLHVNTTELKKVYEQYHPLSAL